MKKRISESNSEFDMELFKSLDWDEKIKYCKLTLEQVGRGSSRYVFILDKYSVIKLAYNEKGKAQNRAEVKIKQNIDSSIVAKIYDYDSNDYTWLDVEIALNLTTSKFEDILGYNFYDFIDILQKDVENKPMPQNEFLVNQIRNDDFYYEVYMLTHLHDVAVGDLMDISSYGMAYRDGRIQIVVNDYGGTQEVLKNYY